MADPRYPVIIEATDIPHAPTPDTRNLVADLVACGLEVPQIAFVLKCRPDEVTCFYQEELTHGLAINNARVGSVILKRALDGDMVAAQFWMKTRAKWVPAKEEDAEAKKKDANLLGDRRKMMDEIVNMVANAKVKEAAAETVARATPGSKRVN